MRFVGKAPANFARIHCSRCAGQANLAGRFCSASPRAEWRAAMTFFGWGCPIDSKVSSRAACPTPRCMPYAALHALRRAACPTRKRADAGRVSELHSRPYPPVRTLLASVQITESELLQRSAGDRRLLPKTFAAAVAKGVRAKAQLRGLGLPHVRAGFNCTPTFGPAADFWERIALAGGDGLAEDSDYVGVDFFPDVFRRVAPDGEPGDLRSSVAGVLETMRNPGCRVPEFRIAWPFASPSTVGQRVPAARPAARRA